MTRTGKTAISTVSASGAGEHVKDVNPQHDHDNAATDAAIVASMAAHEAKFHSPTTPPNNGPTLDIDFANGMDARLIPTNQVPGYGLDSDFLGNLSQVSVANGICTITAERKPTPSGRPYASASMDTRGKWSQAFGTWEARLRYPLGMGFWPAFWMDPANGTWPPEIDIMEAYPNTGGVWPGPTRFYSTLHYGSTNQSHEVITDTGKDLTLDWHTYTLKWTAASLVFSLDGAIVGTVTADIPTTPMYPILGFAVGNWSARADATTPAKATMDIDYLRVWA